MKRFSWLSFLALFIIQTAVYVTLPFTGGGSESEPTRVFTIAMFMSLPMTGSNGG